MRTLNDLYTRLDRVIMKEMPGLYKVETIGDAYLVAANLFVPDPHHAATMAKFALRARQEAAKVPRPDLEDGSTLQMRMGEGWGACMSADRGENSGCIAYMDAPHHTVTSLIIRTPAFLQSQCLPSPLLTLQAFTAAPSPRELWASSGGGTTYLATP